MHFLLSMERWRRLACIACLSRLRTFECLVSEYCSETYNTLITFMRVQKTCTTSQIDGMGISHWTLSAFYDMLR